MDLKGPMYHYALYTPCVPVWYGMYPYVPYALYVHLCMGMYHYVRFALYARCRGRTGQLQKRDLEKSRFGGLGVSP
jgi:hypothetical protein